jgi:putative Holliday junction resolvase
MLVREWQPALLVVGLPTHADGTPHAMTARAQEFARRLEARFGLAVELVDERYTTEAATTALSDGGVGDRGHKPLRDQVAAHVHRVVDLKQQADSEAQQLSAARASLEASQRAANQAAAAVAAARAQTEASLSDARGQVAQLEQQLEQQQLAQQQASSGTPAYLGGPYSIPTYIVMCESGGNYHALNASSGAGGAYQILPSTWRAYGGAGAPQDAPKSEQDRIAAEIWRDSGPSAWACA